LLLLALCVFCLTLLASEAGFRIGRKMTGRLDEAAVSQLYTIQAAVMGLLALLLGFSFAMAESRFDTRRQLVIAEANAIGTAHLRTALIPEPQSSELRRLLRSYVDERLALYRRGNTTKQEDLDSSNRLEREAWPRAAEIARNDPRSVAAGLLLQSLNEVIDLNTKRIEETNQHVPRNVLIVLLIVAVLSMGWVGVGLALGNRRGLAISVILAFLIALVSATVVDLDQPKLGLIRVSQSALLDLQRKMAR
jgi:hypothetical protein